MSWEARRKSAEIRRARALAGAKNPDGALRGPRGFRLCRWCGTEVSSARRTFCSGGGWRLCRDGTSCGAWGCVEEWKIRTQGGFLRCAVWSRDRGVCSGCGRSCGRDAWHADHVVALFRGGDGSLQNVRTLCEPCHAAKTKVERAASREDHG